MPVNTVDKRLNEHDRHIDTLSHAIEGLAQTNGQTNVKLDKLVDAIGVQNVLIEKVNNMDSNLLDSFARRDARITALEHVQATKGCTNVQIASKDIIALGKSVDGLREVVVENRKVSDNSAKHLEGRISTFVSGSVVRWAIGVLITVFLVSATLTEADLTRTRTSIDDNRKAVTKLDKVVTEKMSTQSKVNDHTEQRFIWLEESVDDLEDIKW